MGHPIGQCYALYITPTVSYRETEAHHLCSALHNNDDAAIAEARRDSSCHGCRIARTLQQSNSSQNEYLTGSILNPGKIFIDSFCCQVVSCSKMIHFVTIRTNNVEFVHLFVHMGRTMPSTHTGTRKKRLSGPPCRRFIALVVRRRNELFPGNRCADNFIAKTDRSHAGHSRVT